MSKWKCEICNSSFENFDARGFDNKIYCPLCYYKKLYKDTELERERLNNIINKAKEKSIFLQKRYGYVLDDLTYLLMQGSDKE